MKLPSEMQRKLVWESLFRADGDREGAAKNLGVSRRTFDRWIKELELYDQIDKMGWSRPGPPRGLPRGSSIIRMQILDFIRKHKGRVDYAKLSTHVYGVDDRTSRQNIYTAMSDLKANSILLHNEETGLWTIVNDARGSTKPPPPKPREPAPSEPDLGGDDD